MSFHFNTKPHTLETIPKDTPHFVEQADALIESVTNWTKNKEYQYTLNDNSQESVTTYHTKIDKEHWVSRVSKHDSMKYPYDEMIKYLLGCSKTNDEYIMDDLYNHTKYEMEYIEVLNKWKPIPLDSYPEYKNLSTTTHLSNWYSVITEYELGSPLKTRQFNEFILIQPPSSSSSSSSSLDTSFPKKAYVISLVAEPILNHDNSNDNVQAVYSSIERIELLNDTEWEWRMCTCSDAGGSVPKWIQNAMISKNVAMDVPNYLNWIKKKLEN